MYKIYIFNLILVINKRKYFRSMGGAAAAVIVKGDINGRWITERMTNDRAYMCEKSEGNI